MILYFSSRVCEVTLQMQLINDQSAVRSCRHQSCSLCLAHCLQRLAAAAFGFAASSSTSNYIFTCRAGLQAPGYPVTRLNSSDFGLTGGFIHSLRRGIKLGEASQIES